MSTKAPSITAPHSVLITGGVGFVGHHLVTYFLTHRTFSRVIILSRSAASASTNKNTISGAEYIAGDITNHDTMKQVLDEVKPSVIIHAASPSPVTGTRDEYERVNIHGTKNLSKIAKESEYVRAFIYTSSSTLAKGPEHRDLDESYPLANSDPKASPYARSKAEADIMVLHANYPKPRDSSDATSWAGHLATASLRFPIIYGTHDHTTIPGCLNALAKGQTGVVLGDGMNMWSFCSAENMAISHALLASALLSPIRTLTDPDSKRRVDGEAFNINDGSPYPFWGFARLCWKFAGYDIRPAQITPKVHHLPPLFALGLAVLLEWMYWIFTLGTRRPYNLGRQQVEYACFTHTYNISKAIERLNFRPEADFEDDLKIAVHWCLDEGGWREKLKGVKDVRLPPP